VIEVLFVALFGMGTAQAGAPPSDIIPWDTVWVSDTIYRDDGEPVVTKHPVLFITRDDYEREVLGWEGPAALRATKRDLSAIKELIKAKKKP
jgi:hypothetical protein